jgi:hypothetical protein
MEFDFLVIIDLWNVDKLKETGNPKALPPNIDVYESMNKVLLNNLDFFSFKNIIISNGNLGGLKDRGWIVPERNVRTYLNSFNKSNTFICGTRGEFYYHDENKKEDDITKLFNKDTKFLIAGRVWNICVHNRSLGIIPLLNNGFDVYSSPLLTIGTDEMFTQNKHFVNDKYIEWSPLINNQHIQKALNIKPSVDTDTHDGYNGLKKHLEFNR